VITTNYIPIYNAFLFSQDYIPQAATSKKRSIKADTCAGAYLMYFSVFLVKGTVLYLKSQITQFYLKTYVISFSMEYAFLFFSLTAVA
jgi:hypothetical protein